MKSIILVLIISITTLTISEISFENYSIDSFIYSLKNEGIFEIIKSIKEIYGQDVAILSCEELNKDHSGNCKKVVKEYMPDFGEDEIYTRAQDDNQIKTMDWTKIFNFLIRRYSAEEAILIYKKINELMINKKNN